MVCTEEADPALLSLLYISCREFAQPEAIRFGETVDAPPRFTSVPKMKGAKQSVAGKPWIQTSTNNNSTNNSSNSSSSNNHSSNSSSTNRSSSTANSNSSSGHSDVSARGKRKATDSSSSNSSGSNSSGTAAAVLTDEGQYLKKNQMEQVRQETLEAYAALKKRRRNGNTNYIAHAL
jgi:hypothetical protein